MQLYTLRKQTASDFPAVLARLGAKGYVGVELAGFGDLTAEQLRQSLDSAGLAVSSAHVGFQDAAEFAAALDAHRALGCDTVVVPMLGARFVHRSRHGARRGRWRERARCRRARARNDARLPQSLLGAHEDARRPPGVVALLRSCRTDRVRRGRYLLGAGRRFGSEGARGRARTAGRLAAREGRTGRRAAESDGCRRRRRGRRAGCARREPERASGTSSSSTGAPPTCSTRSRRATTTSSAAASPGVARERVCEPPAVRVAIVGCGVISRAYAHTMRKLGFIELVACVDDAPGRADELASEYGATAQHARRGAERSRRSTRW